MVLVQMARYRSRGMALRPVNRIKHVVDGSATIAAAAAGTFVLATAKDNPTQAEVNTVENGSKINGFYIRFEVASNEAIDLGAIPNFYFIVWKNPGGNLTAPAANTVGGNDNKKFVIHQEMTMIENKGQGSNARTVFNGVVVVPKGYRRMGPNDVWEVKTLCPALDTAQCIQTHYKEFR